MFLKRIKGTVWRFQDFSITQILREINFGGCRSSKTAVLAILGALKMINLVNFSLQKMQEFIKIKIQSLYRRGQENANWLRNVSLMKNPHFWCYQVDILVIRPIHEVVILTKFHQNWNRINNYLLIPHFSASPH